MNECLLNWMDNKTKIVVKFKYGDSVYEYYGYIKTFSEIGVTIITNESPGNRNRMFPWTSVVYIEEI